MGGECAEPEMVQRQRDLALEEGSEVRVLLAVAVGAVWAEIDGR